MGRAYPVAGVAGGDEGAAVGEGGDYGDVGWGDVYRASPGVGDARGCAPRTRVGQRWEVLVEAIGSGRDDVAGELGTAVETGAHGYLPAAPTEGDTPVGRGAEIVDQGAAVGDALVAVPTDLFEDVRDGVGENDVRGGDGERVAQRGAWRFRRAADRDDRRSGPHRTAVGVRGQPPYAGESPDWRGLVDLYAGGE